MSVPFRRRGAPILKEFERIARLKQNRWNILSRAEYRKLQGIFVAISVVEEFGNRYGRDPKKIEGWQRLCRDLGFRRVPQTIEECNAVSSEQFSAVLLENATQLFSDPDPTSWSHLRSVPYLDVR